MRPTTATIEGPFYRGDAPMLSPPYSLVRREGEWGAVLVFAGDVRSTDGEPLAGAVLDIWQASAAGEYAPGLPSEGPVSGLFDASQPPFNLRGRLATGPDGAFEVRTVIPGAYRDPGFGGEDSVRPAHVHVRVTHPGFEPLTTQLFLAGDPHLGADPAGVVRPELVMDL